MAPRNRIEASPPRRVRPLGVSVLLLVAAACGAPEDAGRQGRGGWGGGPPGGPPGGAASVPVEVEPVRREDISRALSATARLESVREVSVVARVSARLLDLRVDVGDEVQEGQVLARLDDSETRSQVQEAEADSVQRRSDLERARRSYEQHLLAREAFEQAESAAEIADARTEQARLRLSWTSVRSPLSGVVIRRSAEVGQVLATGEELLAVADVSRLRAEVELPERDLAIVQVGQRAEVLVDPYPETTFHARVERIAPTISPTTGTFAVRIGMDAGEEGRPRLLPGLFARVRLLVDHHENALIVPRRALLVDRERPAVFVARDGRAELAEVETGFVDGERVEVLGGLDDGARVVVLGQDALAPGAGVRIVGEPDRDEESDDAGSPAPDVARRPAGPGAGTGGHPGGPGGRGGFAGWEQDPERIRAMLQRFQQNPDFKRRWDEAVENDPELATDTEKQAAFLRETMRRFRAGGRGG